MTSQEKASLIAFARLLGVSGSDDEILATYEKYYNAAFKSLSEKPIEGNPVTVIKRPF